MKEKRFFSLFRNILCLALLTFISEPVFAQNPIEESLKWGFEYDIMAPRIGAWHSVNLSGYISQGRIKHSIVFAHIDINNEHLTDESFTKDNLHAGGYRFEIFSHESMRKWSTGLMLLYSMHDVTTVQNQQDGYFDTFFVGIPFGYTWVLWEHLTINPGINILIPLNNRTVKIGIDEVEQAPWGLEPGIRFGYRF